MMDLLSCEGIKGFLPENLRDVIKVEYYPEADSTNTIAKKRAAQGEDEGLFVVAAKQTAGRGRLGRSFYSPDDTGLYMSLLLRPSITPEQSVLITTAAAVSVCDSLEKVGVKSTAIKWVNDVFVDNKKVCGILTEGSFNPQNGTLDYVVLGVGINVYEPESGFPEDIKSIAGAVFSEKNENLRNRIAAEFLNSFVGYYNDLEKREYYDKYAGKCFVIGKDITIINDDEKTSARALGLDENFGLLAELSDGSTLTLNSGEISVRVKT
jgi:BirA family biotin operon repressor/biotin-[acetyl-CoA-carboxylase] ligase